MSASDPAPIRPQAKPETISVSPHAYHGWPTLIRQRSGRLILVYSGGRQAHVCPFGRIEMMASEDGGETWSWPRVLIDSAVDDRDAGVLELASGVLIVTYFTSVANEAVTPEQGENEFLLGAEEMALWPRVWSRLPADLRKGEVASWMIKSEDGGRTWSRRRRTPVNSPHGPAESADGRLLYVGREIGANRGPSVWESRNEGDSWKKIADIPSAKDEEGIHYHELHAVEISGRNLVCHLRSHANPGSDHAVPSWVETLQTESKDGGNSWSRPHPVGYHGFPSHLLRLKNGDLLVTYSHRLAPLGIQARLSQDGGATWTKHYLLTEDAASFDLGYPSTIEREDGVLVTVWYERLASSPKAVLRQIRWCR